MNAPRKARASDPPWFAQGLRFECTGCGRCCSGAPGVVWVTPDEIRRLAEALGLPVGEFARRYLRQVGGRVSLRERADGDCVFLARPEGSCRVYLARPTQCRTFPFWPEILDSEEAWLREGDSCPGIGRGRLWASESCALLSKETSQAARRTARTAHRLR